VQGERIARRMTAPAGTIDWLEHEKAWAFYSVHFGTDQSAERIAERGGFGLFELCCFLDGPPKTWKPRKAGE
jgi:hypothetical protein